MKQEYTPQQRTIGQQVATGPAARESVGGVGEHPVAIPDYLARHYSWAYLWRPSVWFFDHQPIINAILFGQYRRIMDNTLRLMDASTAGKTLQIAGVYGELTPKLAKHIDNLHLIDVARVQLELVERKLKAIGREATLARMNAETLEYPASTFDTAIMFLLLHEMPPEARRNTLTEAARVLKPGGRLVVAEYGEFTRTHWLHRFPPFRWVLTHAEPFLGGFWHDRLNNKLNEYAADVGKTVVVEEEVSIFRGFYRVVRYRVDAL